MACFCSGSSGYICFSRWVYREYRLQLPYTINNPPITKNTGVIHVIQLPIIIPATVHANTPNINIHIVSHIHSDRLFALSWLVGSGGSSCAGTGSKCDVLKLATPTPVSISNSVPVGLYSTILPLFNRIR